MKELSRTKSVLYRFFDLLTWGIGRRRHSKGMEIALSDSPRILLIEFYGLGDLVILSGVLDPLRARWPKAEITLLAPPVAAPLFGHDRRINAVELFAFPWHPHLHKHAPQRWDWKGLSGLIRRLRKTDWDLVLGRSDLAMNLLSWRIHPRYALGLDHPGGKHFLTHCIPEQQDTHDYEGRIWQAYLQKLGCAPTDYAPRIVCDPDDEESKTWLGKVAAWRSSSRALVAIHPGASVLSRCWPLERFRKVAQLLKDRADVLWFIDQNHLLPDPEDDRVLPVRCGLKSFANLVAICDCFLGNDSGGMHIAAALGRPTFAIFGPQRPERFAPPGLTGLFFRPSFPCRPCNDRCQYAGTPPCLAEIQVSEVEEEMRRFLERSSSQEERSFSEPAQPPVVTP